jgi:hypothetical protein
MSDSKHREEETQLEAQDFEDQVNDNIDDTEGVLETEVDGTTIQGERKKQEKKEPVELIREPGRSLLPFARVQKIMKADKVSS